MVCRWIHDACWGKGKGLKGLPVLQSSLGVGFRCVCVCKKPGSLLTATAHREKAVKRGEGLVSAQGKKVWLDRCLDKAEKIGKAGEAHRRDREACPTHHSLITTHCIRGEGCLFHRCLMPV